MKNLYSYLILIISALTINACNNYLKTDSADLLIPESVDDYAPLLLGEAYPSKFSSQISFVNLMTDDVEMGPLYYDSEMKNNTYFKGWLEGIDLNAQDGQYAYIWQDDYSENISDKFWATRYSYILACNTIIDALPTMSYSESQVGKYNNLAAQAYALRAYHYFCLVNTYALPYSSENLDKPGVVLKTSPDIETKPQARATIKAIYDLINNDINKAQTYIEKAENKASKFEITPQAIYFLAARIALFQNDWDKVIESANKFLTLNKSILNLNSIDSTLLGLPIGTGFTTTTPFSLNSIKCDEVVFGFGRDDSRSIREYGNLAPYKYLNYEYGFHTSWNGENSLISLYDNDDLRLHAYYAKTYVKGGTKKKPIYFAGQYYPLKYDYNTSLTEYAPQAWRTPELYLNLAEAYAQKEAGISQKAIDILNQLRKNKYITGSSKWEKQISDFTTKEDLIKFIWQERRRELSFEEIMRFWDIRREGMPAQEHKLFSSPKDYNVYKLRQESPNYVLLIPYDETNQNSDIINNTREVIGSSSNGTIE
jgi:hypothetical protein